MIQQSQDAITVRRIFGEPYQRVGPATDLEARLERPHKQIRDLERSSVKSWTV